MDNRALDIFSSKLGEQVFARAVDTVNEFGMADFLRGGVLVGFSGGADSVLLMHFLIEYRRRFFDFPILAVHVNHMIRGDEAERDERFSECVCSTLDVEFMSVSVDVPRLASEMGVGTEEAARIARYSEFSKIISGRDDISVIAVAHNATDNLETMLFNMMRGTGARGIAGIAPLRDNIIRPLIDIDKGSIVRLLDECGIAYVTDSTNLSDEYTRNYIRNRVIPPMREHFPAPERAASRLSRALRLDDDYITSVAQDFIVTHPVIHVSDFSSLHFAVFARVAMLLAAECGSVLEQTHIRAIYDRLDGTDFCISLPSRATFACERGVCSFAPCREDDRAELFFKLDCGVNHLSGFDADLVLSETPIDKTSLNVYKNSIHADLSSAIIEGEIYLRSRREGDSLFYGGHTHKLKKVFCDLKIPNSHRAKIPLLCDDKGVVWVPGLAVREDVPKGTAPAAYHVAIGIGKESADSSESIHTISEYRINHTRQENNK